MSRGTMRAMVLVRTGSLADEGDDPPVLEPRRLPVPEPGPGEVLVRVQACGVCHTVLDQVEAGSRQTRVKAEKDAERRTFRRVTMSRRCPRAAADLAALCLSSDVRA